MYAGAVKLLETMKRYNTAAIITPTVENAVKLARYLKKHGAEDVQLISSPDERILGRTVIIPLLLAKGLEFDTVILFGFAKTLSNQPDFRRKVYLGCTRALHELYMLEDTALPTELLDCDVLLDTVQTDRNT